MRESRRLPYTVHELYDARPPGPGESVVVARVVCGEQEVELRVGCSSGGREGRRGRFRVLRSDVAVPDWATFAPARDDAWRMAHIIGRRMARG